uniref:HMG box domain-containing protein n=1 Tax=Ditylenchus dipsaci TaxID=166011 RepID=A0A915E3Y8_9BILA
MEGSKTRASRAARNRRKRNYTPDSSDFSDQEEEERSNYGNTQLIPTPSIDSVLLNMANQALASTSPVSGAQPSPQRQLPLSSSRIRFPPRSLERNDSPEVVASCPIRLEEPRQTRLKVCQRQISTDFHNPPNQYRHKHAKRNRLSEINFRDDQFGAEDDSVPFCNKCAHEFPNLLRNLDRLDNRINNLMAVMKSGMEKVRNNGFNQALNECNPVNRRVQPVVVEPVIEQEPSSDSDSEPEANAKDVYLSALEKEILQVTPDKFNVAVLNELSETVKDTRLTKVTTALEHLVKLRILKAFGGSSSPTTNNNNSTVLYKKNMKRFAELKKAIAAFFNLAHKTAVALTTLATFFVAAESKLGILQSKLDSIKKSLESADQDLDKAESELLDLQHLSKDLAEEINAKTTEVRLKKKQKEMQNSKLMSTATLLAMFSNVQLENEHCAFSIFLQCMQHSLYDDNTNTELPTLLCNTCLPTFEKFCRGVTRVEKSVQTEDSQEYYCSPCASLNLNLDEEDMVDDQLNQMQDGNKASGPEQFTSIDEMQLIGDTSEDDDNGDQPEAANEETAKHKPTQEEHQTSSKGHKRRGGRLTINFFAAKIARQPRDLYRKEQYAQVRQANPGWNSTQINEKVAKQWKDLKDRSKYYQLAAQNRDHPLPNRDGCKRKRATTAFNFYQRERFETLSQQPDFDKIQINKQIGEEWKQLQDKLNGCAWQMTTEQAIATSRRRISTIAGLFAFATYAIF